jgi:signal transduction histidine kinase
MALGEHNRRDEGAWRALHQVRLPLACIVALAFALAQVAEAFLLPAAGSSRLLVDVLLWSGLGAVSVWALLSWAAVQERRHRSAEEEALREQRRLNAALQRANANLALLNEVNQRIVSTATPEAVLDYAIDLPARVLGARAAALVLTMAGDSHADTPDAAAPLVVRSQGAGGDFDALRAAWGLDRRAEPPATCEWLSPRVAGADGCLVVPICDGPLALGWVECYLPGEPPADTGELMGTIAGEIGEALGAARRRTRELEARYALDRALEEERARIARDMHDGIAQSLAFVRMRVDLWNDWLGSEPERLPAEFTQLKATLREQIDELRRAIFALRPLDLNELGFAGALRRQVNDFAAQQGWSAALSLDDLPPLLPAIELACFRLLQEALNNVAKHARARSVQVALTVADGGLSVSVADDGRGFDPGAVEGGERLGLRQMRERIASLGGRLTLLARPGEGTTLRAWIPL